MCLVTARSIDRKDVPVTLYDYLPPLSVDLRKPSKETPRQASEGA
jgi:hypothetical protein